MSNWNETFDSTGAGDTPVLVPDRGGLYAPAANCWIDPSHPVETAVVTHAHSDHLREGHDHYVVAEPSVPLVERRLPADASFEIRPLAFGERMELGEATISLHSAGHILGSAQVRVEVAGDVWVVSGDYKRQSDPTCKPFEVVDCDVFVTEATFGLPIYRWPAGGEVAGEIIDWWHANREAGRTSVLFCYAVGKAQRVLAHLTDRTDERVLLHGAMVDYVELYREAGIDLPPTDYVTQMAPEADFSGELVLAPTSAHGSSWMERFDDLRTGFASGWMRVRARKRRRGFDAGFVMSDHCDWQDLLRTIRETGADTVVADHGDTDALVRYVREKMDRRALALDRSRPDTAEGAAP